MTAKINPVLPDDVSYMQPPPSYEEVMGVYMTSVKDTISQQTPNAPELAYIDIMPRCLSVGNIRRMIAPKFDTFSAIIEGANRWLLDNPGLTVWKCETVERKLSVSPDGTLTYDLNAMIWHDSTFGFNVYIKGIRLWLTKCLDARTAPQQLGLINHVPEKVTIEIPTNGCYKHGRIIIGADIYKMGFGFGLMNTFDTYEGLADTIKKLNKKLETNPIAGTILNIETDSVKFGEGLRCELDPEASAWSENKIQLKRITQVIRIFYIKGTPSREQLGIEIFEPEMVDTPDLMKAGRFEPFPNLVQKVSHWLAANQNKRVVNIQQFDAPVVEDFIGRQLTVSSESTDIFNSAFIERRLAKTLRVFYVTSPICPSLVTANYLTSRVFLPARIGSRAFETMIQTMDRIDAWLRVTGVGVYSVETVPMLMQESNVHGADVNKSDFTVQPMSGKYWLTAIRVYFTSAFQEPNPDLLPPVPTYIRVNNSSSCILV